MIRGVHVSGSLLGIAAGVLCAAPASAAPAAAPALGWTCTFRSDTAQKDFVVFFGDMGVSTREIDMTSAKAITEDQ